MIEFDSGRRINLSRLKEMTREGGKLLEELIGLAERYDPLLARCWRGYRDLFYRTYSSWVSDGDVYFAHGIFIALVKQFFYYREAYTGRHRTLFFKYLEDLGARAKKIDPERAGVLGGIARWLEREIGRPGRTTEFRSVASSVNTDEEKRKR
jgi:hypothetical protein